MSYVRHVMQPGEALIIEGRPHWIAYWRAISCLVLVIPALVAAKYADRGTSGLLYIITACLAVLALTFAFHAWFRLSTTEIGVTDRRVIYKKGFISRRTAEMNMDKIETVLVE